MFDLKENYKFARKLAAEGMILLKNEDKILPFTAADKVGVVGENCLDFIKCGGGSPAVMAEYTKGLHDGLSEKMKEHKCSFYEGSVAFAKENDYSVETLNKLSEHMDTAVINYKRFGSEGADRQLGKKSNMKVELGSYSGESTSESDLDNYEKEVGYFYPSDSELQLLLNLEESNIKNVVLILNISSIVDVSFIEQFKKIKSVLLVYLPGMESGTAVADVLCGDVNPGGRLIDTIAYNYEDYPSSDSYDYNPIYTEYKEGIYVGYRHFETFAKDKVMFPFGYGLSYTEYDFTDCALEVSDDNIKASVTVTNIGDVAGKEVVQIYVKGPKGHLPKPEIELRGFGKTKNLMPGESERVTVTFKISEMASFDDIGILGSKAAWVLEEGDYSVFAGKNIRDLYACGVYTQEKTTVTEQLTLRFCGEEYPNTFLPMTEEVGNDKGISLYDVAENKATIEEFIGQLTVDEMIEMAGGQPPTFPSGNSGIGNLMSKGVPNPQSADGAAGIRRSLNTTCFPCGSLIASTWDSELHLAMGKAVGSEGYATGIDVWLAPSLNIHRNPLCGRNFEYLSEDPYISGKTAAAIVKGVQSEGCCATVKHFAGNNCEYYRFMNDSIISERALREIYLKGFEIVIKESNPAFVMSSYNKINGKHASANPQLINGVLRDEWKYEGAVMTDWRNRANLDDEIIAGNNIKMPYGYPEQIELAKKAYDEGKVTLAQLQRNTYFILKGVMKTRAFAQKDFGFRHTMTGDKLVIPALEVSGVSSTRVMQSKREDGKEYLYQLNLEQRGQRTFVFYTITVEEEGEYTVSAELSTNCPDFEIWYENEQKERIGTAYCNVATEADKWYYVDTKVRLKKGVNIIKMVFAQEPDKTYPYNDIWVRWIMPPKEDVKLAELVISK